MIRGGAAAMLLVLLAACGGEPDNGRTPTPPKPPAPPALPAPAEPLPPPPVPPEPELSPPDASPPEVRVLDTCIDEVNRYRASRDLPPLTRSPALDAYAAAAARDDDRVRKPHQYFYRTRGGGVATAENLIPWWRLSSGDIGDVVRDGTAAMWAEGPGGGHYQTMVGAYTEIGCGVFVNGDRVTVVQAFR